MATVLVTGASSGIGQATARRFLEDGHAVYVAARRTERMADLAEAGAVPLALDVTVDEQLRATVDRIIDERGGVDVLVNNAGFGLYGAVEDIPIEDARYQFEVNLFGLARLTQLVLPGMRARGQGRIVNVSSVGGRIYTPLGAWYHASKHALEGWSDALRFELAPHGIDVVVIQPGTIDTGFADVMVEPMVERSGDGPYGALVQRVAHATRVLYRPGAGSPASRVADTIVRAATTARPRPRYAVGKYARPMLLVRRFTTDRIFDRLVRSQL